MEEKLPDNSGFGNMDPVMVQWFRNTIGEPTDIQIRSWKDIASGKSVLIVSPTGSGKTLAAVLPAVDPILKGELNREKTSILYISPMKALGADLVKTLENLSDGLGRIRGKKERKWGRGRRRKDEVPKDARLHIGIRTGDVPQSERRRMLIDPPDLLVTTPENLLLMLSSKARDILTDIRFIIVDEVHEMVPGKRGALLSLTLEHLSSLVRSKGGEEPLRIGLSATIRPETLAARYLGGQDDSGSPRPVSIIKENAKKEMIIEFHTLINGLRREEDFNDRVMDELGSMMDEGRGPLVVFHNTRRRAEEMAYSLVQRGHKAVMPHHGSLGAEVRRTAEEGLRSGDLKAIISSTSLELGIDIGSVDTVCQIASPKDPSRLLQRLGRSGHGLGRTSHGIIYPLDGVDLLESLAVARTAAGGKLEKLKVPKDPTDVLAQFAIGLSLEDGGIAEGDLLTMSRRAYPFRKIAREKIRDILSLLSERLPGPNQPPPRLWYDNSRKIYIPRRNTRQAFYLNCGTIPKETSYKVYDERTKKVIGDLSRDFGESLYERDVILLGSKPYRITGFSGTRVIAHEEPDAQPSIPSWSGEVNPRPSTITGEILKLFAGGCRTRARGRRGIEIHIDPRGKKLCRELYEDLAKKDLVPSSDRWPVETLRSGRSRRIYIFHIPYGRKVTEPLGRVISYGIRRELGAKVDYVATDDGFAISSPKELSAGEVKKAFGGSDFMDLSEGLVLTSSMFRSRFSHCLNKSLLVLSRFRGKDTGSIYRRNRIENLLGMVMDSWYSEGGWRSTDGPLRGLISLAREAMNEVYMERADMDTCRTLIMKMDRGRIDLDIRPPEREASVIGENIIRSWRGVIGSRVKENIESARLDQTRETEKAMSEREGGLPNITTSQENSLDTLTSVLEIGGLNDDWTVPEDIEINRLPMFTSDIDLLRNYRILSTFTGSELGGVLKHIPFFLHPMDVLVRSRGIGYDDLRSALKSSRLKPVRVMDNIHITDPRWAKVFRALARPMEGDIPEPEEMLPGERIVDRPHLAEIAVSAGWATSELVSEWEGSNRMVKWPGALKDISATKDREHTLLPFEEEGADIEAAGVKALSRFLRYFGPFELSELASLFGWPSGFIHPSVIEGVSREEIHMGIGPGGPMGGSTEAEMGPNRIWVWHPSFDPGRIESEKGDGSIGMKVLSSSDPAIIMAGLRPFWIDPEKVRGGSTGQLIVVRNGRIEGVAGLIETPDLVRVTDIEAEEFGLISDVTRTILHGLGVVSRQGYETFVIEKIMGIPAGEAVSGSVEIFIEDGYRPEETPKGSVLIKGPPVLRGVTRGSVLLAMFRSQGLVEGHQWSHPLEVVTKLGSVIDRWEMLSRLGSVRYQRLATAEPKSIREKQEVEWNKVLRMVEGICDLDGDNGWNDLLSSSGERLSDMKDLTKRFSLKRGVMDQPYPVWSLEQEFLRYPPPSKGRSRSIPAGERELLRKVRTLSPEEIDPFLRANDHRKEVEELVRAGMLLEDGWGGVCAPFPEERYSSTEHRTTSKVPRGVSQRNWLVRNAMRLSVFSMEDLLNYSPEFDDRSKVRVLLNDLVGTALERYITIESGFQVIYCVKGMDIKMLTRESDGMEFSRFTVISPRDRMARVVSTDIRGTIAKGHGFPIFLGGRPVALISIKKLSRLARNAEFGENIQGTSSLEYWSLKKAWVDLRYRRAELLKNIRKAFYNLGCQLITDDEKIKLDSLYRDIQNSEERQGP